MEQIKIRTAVGLYLAAILFILSCIMTSCTGSKSLEKSQWHLQVDSSALKERDSVIAELFSETSEYKRQLREAEEMGVVIQEQPCDTASIKKALVGTGCPVDKIDSAIKRSLPAPTTLKKNSDGSFEVTGFIKSITESTTKTEEENRSLQVENYRLAEQHITDSTSLVKSLSVKEKTVKRKSLWWLWMIIGAVVWEIAKRWIPKIPFLNFKTSNMKTLILFVMASIFLMSCGGDAHLPTDNITWLQAWHHVAHSFVYWLFVVITLAALVYVTSISIVAYRNGELDGGAFTFRFLILMVLFASALLIRPCELAENTTVEQAARGVWIGY